MGRFPFCYHQRFLFNPIIFPTVWAEVQKLQAGTVWPLFFFFWPKVTLAIDGLGNLPHPLSHFLLPLSSAFSVFVCLFVCLFCFVFPSVSLLGSKEQEGRKRHCKGAWRQSLGHFLVLIIGEVYKPLFHVWPPLHSGQPGHRLLGGTWGSNENPLQPMNFIPGTMEETS